MRVKIAMAAGDAGDAHALQQHADFLLAVGDGTVQTLPDGDLIRVPDEFLCAGLAGPALRGLITLRVPARPHPRPRCARLRNRRRRAPRPDPRPNWCLNAQCGVQRGLGVVESQQAGLGLLYIRAVLSYCLLLWSYRDIYFELSSFG